MKFYFWSFITYTFIEFTFAIQLKHKRTVANPEEDAYVRHYGNDPFEYNTWKEIKEYYYEEGEPKLRKLCTKAHQKAGYGDGKKIDTIYLSPMALTFREDLYNDRRVDVLTYNTTEDPKLKWYLTEGTSKDCVFYLNPVNTDLKLTEMESVTLTKFQLGKQICGLNVF